MDRLAFAKRARNDESSQRKSPGGAPGPALSQKMQALKSTPLNLDDYLYSAHSLRPGNGDRQYAALACEHKGMVVNEVAEVKFLLIWLAQPHGLPGKYRSTVA